MQWYFTNEETTGGFDNLLTPTVMKTTFTPGQWFLRGENAAEGWNIDAESGRKHYRKRIAHTVGHEPALGSKDVGITREEAEANARLIAAAPALYEALQECIAILKRYPSHDPNGEVWGDMVPEKAKAAINRATQP